MRTAKLPKILGVAFGVLLAGSTLTACSSDTPPVESSVASSKAPDFKVEFLTSWGSVKEPEGIASLDFRIIRIGEECFVETKAGSVQTSTRTMAPITCPDAARITD